MTIGQAGYNNGVLYAPGAELLISGNFYQESLEIAASELVSVFIGDSAYFFYTGVRDSTVFLTPESSSQAMVLAWFSWSGVDLLRANDQASAKHLDADWTLATGIEVSTSSSSNTLTNSLTRWAAVKTADNVYYLQPDALASPRELLRDLWLRIVEYTTDWGAHPETVVLDNNVTAETFGSSFRIWLLPPEFYDGASLEEARTHDADIMNKLDAKEVIELIVHTIENVIGVSIESIQQPGLDCAGELVTSLARVFGTTNGEFWLTNIRDDQQHEGFKAWINNTCAIMLNDCVAGAIGAQIAPDKITKLVLRVLSPFKGFDFAMQGLNLVLGSYDAATSKFYAPLEPPSEGTWVNLGPIPCGGIMNAIDEMDGVSDTCVFLINNYGFCRYCNGRWDSFELESGTSYVDFVSFDRAWMTIENSLVIWTPEYMDLQCTGMDTMSPLSSLDGFWASGRNPARVYFWNGTTWETRSSRIDTDPPSALPPVVKLASNNSGGTYVLAGGNNGGLFNWTGIGWVRSDSTIRPGGSGVSLFAALNDGTVGMNGVFWNDTYIDSRSLLLWRGSGSNVLSTGDLCVGPHSLSSANNVVINCPTEYATHHWNGSSWRVEPYNIGAIMYGLSAISPSDAWAVAFLPGSVLLRYRPE
ncbi:MAG: hypothetical protein IPG71_00335 [bacterium]|nr:hypothetical protein [bacterium]